MALEVHGAVAQDEREAHVEVALLGLVAAEIGGAIEAGMVRVWITAAAQLYDIPKTDTLGVIGKFIRV